MAKRIQVVVTTKSGRDYVYSVGDKVALDEVAIIDIDISSAFLRVSRIFYDKQIQSTDFPLENVEAFEQVTVPTEETVSE